METLFDKALKFASEKHAGQRRKASGTPYILHPAEVAAIIAGLTVDENVMAAGLLHDTVEDTDTSMGEIRETFGDRIAELVASETEDKQHEKAASDTWLDRKKSTLAILKNTNDVGIKMLWLGDKLSNARSLYSAYLKEGDDVWLHFNQKDPAMHAGYYKTVAENVSELAGTAAYEELIWLIKKLLG